MYPILHRPQFERDVAAGLHLRELSAAKVFLLVCALGSRYSTDSRVALKAPTERGREPELQWRSAGVSRTEFRARTNTELILVSGPCSRK